MDKRYLEQVKIKEWLCPYCGRWHEWDLINDWKRVASHMATHDTYLGCTEIPFRFGNMDSVMFCFSDEDSFFAELMCEGTGFHITSVIPLEDFVSDGWDGFICKVSLENVTVTVNEEACERCKTNCKLCNRIKEKNELILGFKFDKNEAERLKQIIREEEHAKNVAEIIQRLKHLKEERGERFTIIH